MPPDKSSEEREERPALVLVVLLLLMLAFSICVLFALRAAAVSPEDPQFSDEMRKVLIGTRDHISGKYSYIYTGVAVVAFVCSWVLFIYIRWDKILSNAKIYAAYREYEVKMREYESPYQLPLLRRQMSYKSNKNMLKFGSLIPLAISLGLMIREINVYNLIVSHFNERPQGEILNSTSPSFDPAQPTKDTRYFPEAKKVKTIEVSPNE